MTQANSAHPVTADRFSKATKARNTLILQGVPMKRERCEECGGIGLRFGSGWCKDCLGMGFIYRAVALLLLMVLCAAPGHAFPWHRSKVDRAFVSDTVAELKEAALTVGLYQRYPPMMTDSKSDALYIQRAEADIVVAEGTLHKYQRHSATKQDVETVMSQLSRDLEDIPPALPDIDPRDKA